MLLVWKDMWLKALPSFTQPPSIGSEIQKNCIVDMSGILMAKFG